MTKITAHLAKEGAIVAVYRLDFGGPLYADIWQCTLHMQGVGMPRADAALDDLVQDLSTWMAASQSASSASLAWVKFNEIDPLTRRYVSATDTYERILTTPVKGSVEGNGLPQQTLCISLLTGAKRGLASRGRFYPPATIASLGADGTVNPNAVESIATAARTLITNLNNWPGTDTPLGGQVVVLGGNGTTRPVTAVSVGNVMDTQRRRRSKLKERYTTLAL